LCGIAGIVSLGERSDVLPNQLVRDMCELMKHRGPDDEAYYSNGYVHLGMRRLAIIDLRKGLYPIRNENGRICLFYNGEIYNFRELSKELVARGHTLSSMTDGEVIAHAYEEWGPDCFKRLNGMWAFALWDSESENLIVAGDHFGIIILLH